MPVTTLFPTQDNYVNYHLPNDVMPSPSTWKRLEIGVDLYDTGTGYHGLCYSFIQFDLSSIPAGATINSANLFLRAHFVRGDYAPVFVDVYQTTTATWDEQGITWNGMPQWDQQVLGSAEMDGSAGPQDVLISILTSAISSPLTANVLSIVLAARDNPQSGLDIPSATFMDIGDVDAYSPWLQINYTEASTFSPKVMIF